MRRWFLSYHSPDHTVAERLRDAIERKDKGACVFFAPADLRAGSRWAPALAKAIAEATAFVLLVTDKGIGRWQEIEYEAALDKHVSSGDFPLALILLEGQPAPRLAFLKQLHWIVTPDPAAERDVARLVHAVASGNEGKPSELWRYTSPYRGLSAMEEKDSDYFFGREAETIEVLRVLAEEPGRLPVLLGNSGVGKSSLAQAGVIAALRREAWPERARAGAWPATFKGARGWCFLTLKPGAEPIKALVEAFMRTWQYDPTDPEWEQRQKGWVERLTDGRATLRGLLDATERRYEEIGQPKPPAFFLYVDQGEELYVRGERQRARFAELLAQAMADSRLVALMSLRSDFLGHLQSDEPLFAMHRKVDVPPLREAELSRVIREPARQLSARFDPEELVSVITRRTLEDSAKDVGALPLLSYTLDDMWTEMVRRGDGVLRLPAGAFELGGVLAERANAFLARNPNSEDALRRVLTIRLAAVRKEGDPTRRRARRSEFSDDEWRLVTELADHPNRLLVTVKPEGGETFAEVAHEAIFRRWEKLRDWMSLEREFLAWKTTLDDDYRRWEDAPDASKRDALLLGLALAQAQSWLVKRAEDLSRADREFIDFSQKAEDDRREARRQLEIQRIKAEEEVARLNAEREAEKQKERAAAANATVKRNRRRYYWISAAAGLLLVGYFTYSGYANRLRLLAIEQQEAAIQYREEAVFQRAVTSAGDLLDQVGASLNHGDITVRGAQDMLNVATGIVEQVKNVETPQTIELVAKLARTASDIHATLGNLDQAYLSAKSSKDLLEPFHAAAPNDPKFISLLYHSVWRMGDAIADRDSRRSTQEQALKLLLEGEQLARRLTAMAPEDGDLKGHIVFALQKIGDVRQTLDDWPTAIAVYSEALKISQDVADRAPENRDARRQLANSLSRLGQALTGKGELDAALERHHAAFKIRTDLGVADRNDDVMQFNLVGSHRDMARTYTQSGDLQAALAEYQSAIAIQENLQAKDPANARWLISVAPLYAGAGDVLRRKGDLPAALEQYRKAYTVRRGLALRDPSNPGRQEGFAAAGMAVADVLVVSKGDLDEAAKLYRGAIESVDDLRPRYDRTVFLCYIRIGDILKSRNDPDSALAEYKVASAIARESATKDAASATWQRNLEISYAKIGDLLAAQGRTREMFDHYREVLDFVVKLAAQHPENTKWAALAQSLKTQTDKEER